MLLERLLHQIPSLRTEVLFRLLEFWIDDLFVFVLGKPLFEAIIILLYYQKEARGTATTVKEDGGDACYSFLVEMDNNFPTDT